MFKPTPRSTCLLATIIATTGCIVGEWPDTPTTDGPFEVQVSVSSELDPDLVKAGLFAIYADAVVVREDGTTETIHEENFDILVSAEGKVKAWRSYGGEGVRFRPQTVYPIDEGGRFVAELPEDAPEDSAYRLVVWYDADGDGEMLLSSSDIGELAHAPGRIFPENDGHELYLFSIRRLAEEEREADEGAWNATAYGLEPSTGDEGDTYLTNMIRDRELTDWTVNLGAAE